MNQARANSSPDLACPLPEAKPRQQQYDDPALEGVAANIKLLLKLILDHKEACAKGKNDNRRTMRIATMLAIVDNVRERIQKSQALGSKPELRRCNTDVRYPDRVLQNSNMLVAEDEKEKLKRELSASLAARKSLQVMCSSLGKEKEIMAAELSRKVQELSGMEELVHDLKAQNENLLQKVQECSSQHQKIRGGVVEAMQERNKTLSGQLARSLDGNRAMKIAQEDNVMMVSVMDEMRDKVMSGLVRVRKLKEHQSDLPDDVQEEMVEIESVFEESLQMLVMKHDQKQDE